MIFGFYWRDGALVLPDAVPRLNHGRLVVHITEMTISEPPFSSR